MNKEYGTRQTPITATSNTNKYKDKMKKNLYAQYDDENAGTHYFLVPATRDPNNFMREFQELNMSNNSKNTHSTVYMNDRNNIRSQRIKRTKSFSSSSTTSTRQHLNTNTNKLKIPSSPKTSQKTNFPSYSSEDEDYCTIKADTKTTFQPSRTCILSSANTRLKKQHLSEYNHQIKKKDSIITYADEKQCLKKNNKLQRSELIDVCTCMFCVRSVSYNYTGTDDGEFLEPCSCQGSTKSIVGRYVCMGILAVFFPCMLCYLPAKACCGSKKSWKHKQYRDDTYVQYTSNNNKPL